MNDQSGAEQLGAIATSQLPTIAGGVMSPNYRLSHPSGSYREWYPPSYPSAPPPVCHPTPPPTFPFRPFSPGFFGGGFGGSFGGGFSRRPLF